MGGSRTEVLLLLLTGVVLLLMVALIGLFIRMEQLQREALAALEPLHQASNSSGLSPGTKAPGFALPDLSGQPVSLDRFAGREVLLVFASPRCPACREMYPHLQAFAREHPEVAVVMVSQGSGEENRQVAQEQGFAFPVLEGNEEVTAAYRVPGTPFFYVLDGEGVIRRSGFAVREEEIEALVAGKE
ncbi:MAG: TlpA family protein disulfide reductase [Thermoflexales bacterium]|nr:TlpA family protein disulfide reductase [Thermoflexales bacterium]